MAAEDYLPEDACTEDLAMANHRRGIDRYKHESPHERGRRHQDDVARAAQAKQPLKKPPVQGFDVTAWEAMHREAEATLFQTTSEGEAMTPVVPRHRHLTHSLNELAARVHVANAKWWADLTTGEPLKRNLGELMMLTVSELAEAMEGHRKSLMDDKLPTRKMFDVELADAYIRVLDVAGGHKVNLDMWTEGARVITWSKNVGENLLLLVNVAHRVYQYGQQAIVPIDITELLVNIEELATYYYVDLLGAFEEKMAYNAVRADHTHEHRKGPEGKKY